MMRLLGAPGGTGVPRIVRFRQVDDRAAVRAFFSRLAELPALVALTSAHGAPVLADCAGALKVAGTSLLRLGMADSGRMLVVSSTRS